MALSVCRPSASIKSYFKQEHYSEAIALLLCFYALIGTRRLWARPATAPFLIIASLLVLPETTGGSSTLNNLARFFGHDIVPAPLRNGNLADGETWIALGEWFSAIIFRQALPGALQTFILAQIALVAAAILALTLYPIVSRRFLGRAGHYLGRVLLVIARSTPEYMLAYLLLQLMGPSMLPAIIALSLHNGAIVSYLLGRQTDELAFRATHLKASIFTSLTPRPGFTASSSLTCFTAGGLSFAKARSSGSWGSARSVIM